MGSIGIAMVGCGQIAEAHLKGVAELKDAQLVWCVDSDAKRAGHAAERYGALHSGCDYAEALADSDVDAMVLCLPHDLHAPFAIQAAEAGKHILVEKPMALDEHEACDMVAAAKCNGVQLSVGQSTRFLPTFQEAKRVLDAGQIGRIVNVIHQRIFWIEQVSTEWRKSQHECGGLYLPLFGSHDVDAILWLLNDQPNRVWGTVRSDSHVTDGDSDGFIGLEFADGKIGSLAFSVQSKQTRSETTFIGREGTLTIRRSELLLNNEAQVVPEQENAFLLQMRRFVEALIAGKPTPTQGQEVLHVMRTLDLVRESSVNGKAMNF